jgi:hypothetical protein
MQPALAALTQDGLAEPGEDVAATMKAVAERIAQAVEPA